MKKEIDFVVQLYDLMKKHNIPMKNAKNMINDVVKLIAKSIQSTLKVELDEHLSQQKNQLSTNSNYRNNYSKKTIKSSIQGKTLLKIPRDKEATFKPKLIKKRKIFFGLAFFILCSVVPSIVIWNWKEGQVVEKDGKLELFFDQKRVKEKDLIIFLYKYSKRVPSSNFKVVTENGVTNYIWKLSRKARYIYY